MMAKTRQFSRTKTPSTTRNQNARDRTSEMFPDASDLTARLVIAQTLLRFVRPSLG